jgi:hypothetical protein
LLDMPQDSLAHVKQTAPFLFEKGRYEVRIVMRSGFLVADHQAQALPSLKSLDQIGHIRLKLGERNALFG